MRIKKVNPDAIKLYETSQVKLKTAGNTREVQFTAGNNTFCPIEILSEITYSYDEAGNVVSKDESTETGAVGTISSVSMTYDKANRLLTYNGENVTYDAEGNMTYGPDAEGNMTEYKYNCRNQLIQAGNITYEYDAEGNRTAQTNTETGVRTEYVVNTVSELSQVLVAIETSKNSETANGSGDDIKAESTKNSETITNASVSGDGAKTETTKDSEAGTNAETAKITTYVYGNGLITQQSEGEYLVFHYNNIGSTILLTNAKGEAEETYSYGPYGELLSGDKNKTTYLYNGMYGVATDDNGLYYMRARYYNVSIKRFINQDIVNGSITNSQSLNKFSYVQGNPIKLTDPFGLFPCISLSGIGHAALDVLGMIPFFEFFDAINAAWYYKEGDFANGTLSMVAVAPFIGSAAATGVKWGIKAGSKATKIAETVKLGSKISAKGKSFIVSGGQALEAVKNLCKNVVKTGKISWKEIGKFPKLGLKVAEMGDAGASIAKNGDALKALSKGQDIAKSVAVSNTTKKVASESGKGTYLKMNLQFFAEKSNNSKNPVIDNMKKRVPNDEVTPPNKRGNAPISNKDGKPIEIHHNEQEPLGPFNEMHPSDHRYGANYKKNHPNYNKKSKVDRTQFREWKKEYWEQEWDNGRWND